MNRKIDEFIDLLSNFDTDLLYSIKSRINRLNGILNQYSPDIPENSIRRENLRIYMKHILEQKPNVLMIGEAPGYKGCRLTGVPFTSEQILIQNENIFGYSKGFRISGENNNLESEQTATIVWEVLEKLLNLGKDTSTRHKSSNVPMFWNAFPFHPFKGENTRTNRKPTGAELIAGEPFLRKIIAFSNFRTIIALGNAASDSLTSMQLPHTKIRHPSHGGKREFEEGLKKILTKNQVISLTTINY